MLNKFTITYSSGLTEEIQSSNETAELQSNATFGMGLAQANEMGCNVTLDETITEDPEWVSTEGEITSFLGENPTFAESKHDYSDTIAAGQKITLEAVTGEDDAKAAIDGKEAVVIECFPVGMQLDLDLSEVNVEGLTAKFESLEPEPVEEPVPPPPEVDEEVNPDMVTISYLTRAFPTVGYMSDVDVQKIAVGDWLTFTAIAGLEDMTPYADGKSGEVQAINGTQVQFNLDLSEADTSGMILTALPSTETGDGGGDVDPPDPGDATGTITAFSMANPTEVTMDSQDEAMLTIGETITLEALSGDEFAQDLINGLSVPVLSKDPVTLDIDLSAVEVAGLTADFVIDAGAPVPAAKKKGKADKEPAKVKVSVSKEKELPIPPAMSPQEAKKSAPKIQPATTTVPWGQPSEPIEETKESQHQQGLELPTGGGEPPTTKKK